MLETKLNNGATKLKKKTTPKIREITMESNYKSTKVQEKNHKKEREKTMIFAFNGTLTSIVKKDLQIGKIPMLCGEVGIGKSSWTEDLANQLHTQIFTLPCNQLADKSDLTGGRLVPDDKGGYKQFFYPHQAICDAINYAIDHPRETPILFLDELNRTPADVTSACLSLATARSIGSIKLPDNLQIMCAGNDKGNITSLDEASLTRFSLYHVKPDVQTFLNLDPELNIFVRNVLTAHPEVLFCKKICLSATGNDQNDDDDTDDTYSVDMDLLLEENEMAQLTCPRTITGISKWLNTCDNKELLDYISQVTIEDNEETNALAGVIEAKCGKTMFSALLLQEIAQGISSTNNQATVVSIPKPNCYEDFKKCTTVNDLEDFVDNMNDTDKSGCLLYALYENTDNTVFIQALAPKMSKLEPSDMKTLMGLYSNDKLDSENLHVLLNGSSNISTTLNMVMG